MAEPNTPKSATPPNAPGTPGAAAPSGSPTAAGKAPVFDIATYRKGAPAPAGSAKPAKERGPKVKFGDLAGIEGLRCRDPFEGDSEEYGHWYALRIVGPDGAEATAISNEKSEPGHAIRGAMDRGLFDDPTRLVPLHVRRVNSTVNPEFVRVLLRFGGQ